MIAPMAASLIAPMASSLMHPVASSLIKGVMRARKGQQAGFLPSLTLSLMMKVLGKQVRRA